MKLHVWTTSPSSKTITALSPVLAGSDVAVEVVKDFHSLPAEGTTLVLGKEPKEVLEATGLFPKGRTITSLRNKVWSLALKPSLKLIASYSPGILESDYGKYVDLLCDAKLAIRLLLTGKSEPPPGNYRYVDCFSELIADIEREAAKKTPVDVAHDTETLGLDPLHKGDQTRPPARFVTWQFSHKPGMADVLYFKSKGHFESFLNAKQADGRSGFGQIAFLLQNDEISLRMANGKYDLTWHWHHTRRLESKNFRFDTTLVGSLLDENRGNGLDVHAKIYSSIGGYSDLFDQTVDKSRMDLVPPEKLLPYAAGDTDATLQVATAQKAELLKDARLARFYVNVTHKAARAFEVIERGGICVDMEAYADLRAKLLASMNESVARAREILGGRLYAKHRDPDKPGGLNIRKASLIYDFMFSPSGLNLKPKMLTEKTEEPSTSLDHLLMFKDHPEAGPFVALQDDFGSAQKTLSTYVEGFLSHLRSDGRFHPSYFLHKGRVEGGGGEVGATTGRLSARDPAIQTVPKLTKWAKLIRKCFVAPPGFLMGERDYNQGELRVIACVANELNMIAAYLEGKDLHCLTASGIAGLTYDQMMALEAKDPELFKKYRQQAKPSNFGLAYKQGAEGFRLYCERNYGVILTLDEAAKIRSGWFAQYPGISAYHDRAIADGRRHGQVVSPLGRIRHLPLINSHNQQTRGEWERMAINSPIQSTLSDMMIWSLGLEWAEGLMRESPVFAVVHDAAYDYLPEDSWEKHAKRKKEIMENLPFEKLGWSPQLKFPADYKVGKNMADLKPVKL